MFAWAKSAAIPPERVQTKHITLNFETGILKDLNPLPVGLIDLPIAYWHRKADMKSDFLMKILLCLTSVICALESQNVMEITLPPLPISYAQMPNAYIQISQQYGIPSEVFLA